jgi:hypothetical protein
MVTRSARWRRDSRRGRLSAGAPADVLLVDWLGRAGIAQCTEAWAIELSAHGQDVRVVTRRSRELGAGVVKVDAPARDRRGLPAHVDLVRYLVDDIHRRPPRTVVVQNYVVPAMELAVLHAARRVGARVILVVHDHRQHGFRYGFQAGLSRLIRSADVVVAHTDFVADAIGRRDVEVIPHPVCVGMLNLPEPATSVLTRAGYHERAGEHLAAHFGVLSRRANKGTSVVEELATRPPAAWRFAFLGVNAPHVDGAVTVGRFLEPAELVQALRQASAALLPYRFATQSGAVVLAQALGVVPIATRVGGLVEQITSGETGLLVDRDASVGQWSRLLEDLDGAELARLGAQAKRMIWAAHERFVIDIVGLVGAEQRSADQ